MLKQITTEQALAGSGSQLAASEVKELLKLWKQDMVVTPAFVIAFIVEDVRETHENAKDMKKEDRDDLRIVVVNTLTGLVKAGFCTKVLEEDGEEIRGKYMRTKKTSSQRRSR